MRVVKVTGTSQTVSFADTPNKDLYQELEKEIRAYYKGSEEKLEDILDYFGEMLQKHAPYKVFLMIGSLIGVHGILVKGLIRMAHNKLEA